MVVFERERTSLGVVMYALYLYFLGTARFGFLPLSLAGRYGINRLIGSRNYYELIQRGFVIPASNGNDNILEPIRTLDDINSRDKGGMIFSPQIGLHENVVVLDYEYEYANVILRYNLSYETEKKSIVQNEKGLLPTIIEKVLDRRMLFKNLQKKFVINTNEWYRSLFPHVSAAIRLREAGKSLVRGENFQYVHTNAQHKNPLCRVTPLGLIKQEEEQKYEKESILICCWRQPKRYSGILVLIV